MLGHDNPSLWYSIECIQQDAALVSTELAQAARGEPPAKRRKQQATVNMQRRLKTLCNQRASGEKEVHEVLRGLGKNVRLQ